ncbi:uncharacterized protein SCHCODRAFT_0257805 [Schizophyllum commune H4-8]|uniref:F-box domain-containing protein n=1 Tax=Schizophyllum commune (strain H4-8 / FGSC 9210) TaxID=578458 RepID=D8QAB3_SCHCM|nr:uncharacterized protein SCHCODRAFT_0257805 [Schizophyllum commune H4-8]KAI5890074.1 hypothetical protein SCHCODRAFT_0257805 [Schizophyllum commune H4-8]
MYAESRITTMADLSKLPQDIIYHLLSFLSVEQSLALSQTCRTLHHLARSDQSYWFTALHSSKYQGHTTAYLSAVDLSSDSDLASLQRHVQNCIKFERLWEKPKLTPTRTTKGRLPDVLYCLFGVHRTNFVVMHSPHSGFVYCWDNMAGEERESIYLGTQITDTSPLNEFSDRVTIALLIQQDAHQHIKLLSVSTEPNAAQVMELRHVVDLGIGTRSFNIFLSEQMVGVTGNENDHITIHAINIHTYASSTIRTDVQLTPTSYMVAMTFNDSVYLVDMNPPRTRVFCCAPEFLPFGNAPSRTMHLSLLDTRRDFVCDDLDRESNDYYCALVSGSGRGVAFTTLTQLVGRHALHIVLWDPRSRAGGDVPIEPTKSALQLDFDPESNAATESSISPATPSTLPYPPRDGDRPFPSPAQHISIPGSMLVPLGPWYLVHFPNSGRHLLLAVGREEDEAAEIEVDEEGESSDDYDDGEDDETVSSDGEGGDDDAMDASSEGETTEGLVAAFYAAADMGYPPIGAHETEPQATPDAQDPAPAGPSNPANPADPANTAHPANPVPAADTELPLANATANGDTSHNAVLYLVHYVPETASHSVHEVPFPEGVDPRSVTSLSFDDYNAVVTLTTLEDVAYCMHLI